MKRLVNKEGRAGKRAKHEMRAGNGCIIIADIVAFSEKPAAEQPASIKALDGYFYKAVKSLKLPKSLYVNSTGDGFIAVLPTNQCKDPWTSSLSLCREILKKCSKRKPVLKVRFGIHKGDYYTDVPAFRKKHMIGKALNHAARVVTVGDESHAVVSEDFFATRGDEGEWRAKFSEPFEVAIKHNRLATVRFYRGDGNGGVTFNDLMPRRVRFIQEADNRILDQMKALEEALVAQIGPLVATPKLGSRAALRARLSVFVLDEARSHLRCSQYRYHWKDGRVGAGPTRYGIAGTGVGAPGVAFNTRKPVVVRDLPDPDDDLKAYIHAWVHRPAGEPNLNLEEEHIRNWKRRPRALVAVPIDGDDGECAGVLCVDTRHPLGTDVPKDVLDGFIESLKEKVARDLAWNLHVRRSVLHCTTEVF